MEIMTFDNPRWREFADRLGGPEGCDFQEDHTWKCRGGNNKAFATAILERMGGIDIPASLDYFDKYGGHCDCEILFNVDRPRTTI